MNINDILNDIDVISSRIPPEANSIPILSLCHNSKYATPTCVFFCKRGALVDGHAYAYNAYANGARIFVAERELELPFDAAVIITANSSDALKTLAIKFYGDASKDLKIIGITGTKGKTTVAMAAYKIAIACGIRAGYIGTNGIYYNGNSFETANTTPDVLELQKALYEMREHGISTVMLEVSSQAIMQERIYGLEFDTCVFTNLYRDHVGHNEHPSFEHYRDTKKSLFSDYKIGNVIINADSQYSTYMTEDCKVEKAITTSASGNKNCSLYASETVRMINHGLPGISFKLNTSEDILQDRNKSHDVFIPMPGKYSVENALMIIAVCISLGLKIDSVLKALASISIPGRFETVPLKSKPNSLFVIDYAHNGASLKAVIDALREYSPKNIICLFGSVGGRTYERRRELGEVARDNSDIIIITSDNPDIEDPMKVIADIRSAIGNTDKPIYMIADRGDAVKKAYMLADDGDFVLLAGKGHEKYQLIAGKKIPFSERNILESADFEIMIAK